MAMSNPETPHKILDIFATGDLPSLREETIMRSLRRFSAVSIAFLPAILLLSFVGARAQSAPTPSVQARPSATSPAWVFHVSPPLTTPFAAPQLSLPSATAPLPRLSPETMKTLMKKLDAEKLTVVARNDQPCYTMRTYGFTTPKEGPAAPQMTSYKTCTPASQRHLRELVIVPQPTKPAN